MNTIDITNWEILIVDDEPDNLTVLDTLLNFFDARVTSANSGEEALELLKTRNFKLGLFDIQMPKVSGWDLVKWVRENDKPEIRETCLIAVTALAMRGDEERILEAGFDGYVAKPIDATIFMDAVQAVLAKPKRDSQQPQEPKAEPAPVVDSVGISEKMSQVISEVRTHTERIGDVDMINVADLLEANGHLLDIRYELEPQDDYPNKAKAEPKATQEAPVVASTTSVEPAQSAQSVAAPAEQNTENKSPTVENPTTPAQPVDSTAQPVSQSTQPVENQNGTVQTEAKPAETAAPVAVQPAPTVSTNGAHQTENPATNPAPVIVNTEAAKAVQEAK